MDDMAFKPSPGKCQKNHAAGKGMAIRPAVKPAHYVFLYKNGIQAF